MTIISHQDTLTITDVTRLTAADFVTFRSAIAAKLAPEVRHIEIDLSHTEQIDCAGLGALLALRKHLAQHHAEATLSLRAPSPPVRRLLQLSRADELFPIAALETAQAQPA